MKRNAELRAQAYMALEGNWKMAAIITLVYFLIEGGIQCGVDFLHRSLDIISILLMPIVYGYSIAFLALVRGEELQFERLFDGFKDYGRVLGTLLLTTVYTLLWALLLIIPGIVKGYSYAMTNYILRDEPQLRFNGAIEKSMDMMSGYKMKLFLMDLSFIGWAILCLLTLGIGFLFLAPYVAASHAAFYQYVKEEYMKDQVVEY
jgi:Predicted integral membrane protein